MIAWNSVFFYSLACWTIQVQENDNKEKNFHMQIVHVTRVWFQEKPIQMTEKKTEKHKWSCHLNQIPVAF